LSGASQKHTVAFHVMCLVLVVKQRREQSNVKMVKKKFTWIHIDLNT